jgi:hypothetical protein
MLPAVQTDFRPEPRAACFSVVAEVEPGVMPRILELFAKRGWVPTHWYSRVWAGELTIEVQMPGLNAPLVAYLAACLRQIPGVKTVLSAT